MSKTKAAAYHGVENVKFAPKTAGAYAAAAAILPVLYAKSLNPSSLLEAVEQHADNRLLFRVPNDKGYDVELGTTAPDPGLDQASGAAMDGASGVIATGLVSYARGALYYEYIERDADGVPSKVKCWMLNVEVGKGAGTHATDESSISFGAYTYPMRVYGDTLMASSGSAAYVDDKGLGRTAFLYTSRPGDADYATFGDAVPAPKLKASAG